MVRGGGRVESVERLGHDADGGVEADAVVRAGQIVVEGLGHAHHGCAAVGQPVRDPLRSVAADGDQSVDVFVDGPKHALASTRWIVQVVAASAEQRPALADDAAQVLGREGDTFELAHQSGPAVRDADDLVAVAQRHVADGSYSRVQSRGVAARGENTDAHAQILLTQPVVSLRG